MADAVHIPDEAETRARWGDFAWTPENAEQAKIVLSRYPKGREQSAVMPLLDLAQRQVGVDTQTQGWLPVPVIEFVAKQAGVPYMRVYEVVTFYTMYNMAPVGRFHVQVCGTTPCMLRGSDDVLAACKNKGLVKGKTTPDGLFTLTEVECLGACANAPMVQINDDNFEDLTYDSTIAILEALAEGRTPKPGSQIDRQVSAPEGGPTTLKEMVSENHDYRGGVGVTVEETRFITEMLRGIRSDMTDVKERMLNMELRQTAIEHRLTGIDTHLIALQHSVSGLSSDMRRVKQRLELVDGE